MNYILYGVLFHKVLTNSSHLLSLNLSMIYNLNDILREHPTAEKRNKIRTQMSELVFKYTRNEINPKYVWSLLSDSSNEIIFYCMDNSKFDIHNCPSILIYRNSYDENGKYLNCYILLTCTGRKFRNSGYASLLFREFIANLSNTQKIILSSVESSVMFYEKIGFKWTTDTLSKHEDIAKYELFEDKKEYFMMVMDINSV